MLTLFYQELLPSWFSITRLDDDVGNGCRKRNSVAYIYFGLSFDYYTFYISGTNTRSIVCAARVRLS